MPIRTVKVNRVKVKAIPKEKVPLEYIKGSNMFEDPYANIFILAKKNSGKTTVEFNILKKCVNKRTTVVIFAGQFYKDASYKHMSKWMKARGIPYIANNSIYDEEGQNQLKELVDHLKNEYKDEGSGSDNEPEYMVEPMRGVTPAEDDDEDSPGLQNSMIRPSKRNKLAPDYLFIFDDLSEEIKSSPQVAALLKTNRHYKSKVIICSQYLNDLKPDAISNLDYVLVFSKIPVRKLEELHGKLNLDIDYGLFQDIYEQATSKPYNFLYIDVRGDRYRKNFDEEFLLTGAE